MKTAILLSYKGLGTNLLHLSYCHQIAKKVGPITVITLCKNLEHAISKDPLIKEVIYLKKYHKKLFDIFKLSNFLKKFNFDNIYIFYPSLRYFISSKIAGIKNIYCYSIFNKKNLHLVHAAKKFTEKNLDIQNCPTETNLYIDPLKLDQFKNEINKNKKNIILGVGSSGPTTRWGSENFISLINELNKKDDYFFYLLCGPNESEIAKNILEKVDRKKCNSLIDKNISDIVPLISVCDLYIGNDSFGQHVAAQSKLPSFIIILDTPRAYSDYSKNQYRILPRGINENDITHDSAYPASSVSVEMVLNKIKNFI
ncbi:lipopolysaccharide heptosyltransferase family protein [Candidatus Pelagibacter sp.]|nr:lipopolysaccharide heptosyltransferase family protein [Candidatus Pelagibacter sp.]